MKRTKYVVTMRDETARFSALRHAMLFACMLSDKAPGHLIEVHGPDAIFGQYRSGKPTPEFTQHHIDGIFQ